MGKTIQMISLLLAEPGKPNLIVAPTVAIVQWSNEIKEHAPSLKVLIFHGSNRTESMSELMKHDVVLTTCMLSYIVCYYTSQTHILRSSLTCSNTLCDAVCLYRLDHRGWVQKAKVRREEEGCDSEGRLVVAPNPLAPYCP